MADLHKTGLKRGNDVSENLTPKFPYEHGPCPSLHYPLPPPREAHLWRIFFALPATNGPLPAC